MTRALVARLDSAGDVLLAGPAVRAVAAGADHLTLLVSTQGAAAGELLPAVDDLMVWPCPWTGFDPPAYDRAATGELVERLRARRLDVAMILTSDHQSPLPLALLLRQAGVPVIIGSSHDYPGSLLDVRHGPVGAHEVERDLSLAAAAGFSLPAGDSGALAVRADLPAPPSVVATLRPGYVVLHPTASVPARSLSPRVAAAVLEALCDNGFDVAVTGAAADPPVERPPAGSGRWLDLIGRTSLGELASTMATASCVVAVNTGPAHLAAAVGVPVVSLFAPVVPAAGWRPWGVPCVVLGDQDAACAGTRSRVCPCPGHPCIGETMPALTVDAVRRLVAVVGAA